MVLWTRACSPLAKLRGLHSADYASTDQTKVFHCFRFNWLIRWVLS